MKKRLFSLVLALALCLGLTVPAFALMTASSLEDKATAENWPKYGQPETGLFLYTEIKTIAGIKKPIPVTCYGLKDSSGNIVLPANHSSLKYLGPDRLLVGGTDLDKNGYAVVDLHGKIIIPYGEYEVETIKISPDISLLSAKTGLIWWDMTNLIDHYPRNFYMGLYDWNGNAIFEYGNYRSIDYEESGFFVLTTADGKKGIYEYGVGMTLPFQDQYRAIEAFEKTTLFRVETHAGLVGVIDERGSQILPCIFEYIPYRYTQGCFVVSRFTDENTKNNFRQYGSLTSPESDRLEDALVDGQGKYLIPFGQFDSIRITDSGYVDAGMWTGKYKYSGFGGDRFGKIYNYTYHVKLADLLAEKGGTALPYSPPSTDTPGSGIVITTPGTGEITIPISGTNPSEQTPSVPNNSDTFTDVKSTDYYADAVKWAVEKNITSGTSKTTFSPNSTCTNAQILAFLYRANGSPEPTISNPFADVKATDYYYKAALWAAEKGMVSGSTFGANTPCTRAATVEYMWKAAGSPAASYDGKFDDVPASADYAQAVAWALENGVTSGTSKTTFGPASTCTRGQIVTFLYHAFGK